jgi:hypothetical protein
MTITLDDDHASTADVKAGVEQVKGFRPAMQELFRYDESWTGTEASGGSGHTAAQEDAALVEEGFEFEGPCSLMVSVNQSHSVVLEGQEEGKARHGMMGVYERVEDKKVNGRGVWQALSGLDCFLYYDSSKHQWMVSGRKDMEAGNGKSCGLFVNSIATTPDQITEQWDIFDNTAWVKAPKLRVRVCSSVETHAAEQRVEQEQEQALEQAQQSRRLVLEGIVDDFNRLMGIYALMEAKVVNRRAVWQKQDGVEETFLYYSGNGEWYISDREQMEPDNAGGFMHLVSAALTPDQPRPSEVWEVGDGTKLVASPEVRVRRQ